VTTDSPGSIGLTTTHSGWDTNRGALAAFTRFVRIEFGAVIRSQSRLHHETFARVRFVGVVDHRGGGGPREGHGQRRNATTSLEVDYLYEVDSGAH